MKHQDYVAGFMFSEDKRQVALIRKNKPAWQAGKLNGIGGKVEPGETELAAMVREFREEAGAETDNLDWFLFAIAEGRIPAVDETFSVAFFVATGDLARLRSMTPEQVEITETASLHPLRRDATDNLASLVALAIDYLEDARPSMVRLTYK